MTRYRGHDFYGPAADVLRKQGEEAAFEKWKKSIKATAPFFRFSESIRGLCVAVRAGFYCPECGAILESTPCLMDWGLEISRSCTGDECNYRDWLLENRAERC